MLAWIAPTKAQVLYQTPKEMERRGLANTTTYVQLLGDADYDNRIREALEEGWSLTRGIEFVQPGDSLGDVTDATRSYISIWRLHTGHSRSFLVFWQGGEVWDGANEGGYSNANYWKS